MDMEHNVNYRSGVKTEQKFSESQGESVFGVNSSVGVESDLKNKQTYFKGTLGIGAEGALGVGLRGNAGIDVIIPTRDED
jgi:hypothetical protein